MSTAANKIQNPDEIVLELTQAEIWDDSMLVEAWDEAMGEYKKYHSIAATGEDPKILVETMEKGAAVPVVPDAVAGAVIASSSSGEAKIIGPVMPRTEDQDPTQMEITIEESPPPAVKEPETETETVKAEAVAVETEAAPAGQEPAALTPPSAAAPFPFSVQHPAGAAAGYAIGGNDEVMRNLMMSWYWAGYYAGLHEGRQQGQQPQQ
ncbi:hypothetical protein BZA05DRAFT_150123 [Tricharina praecox]|uniref:uncharacterized protein n=1 Tax=Tricharina praecox TaxID=43433 RepID=UPI002220B5D6|nr:uncharacterized protein BZA05DRAFT_150123 [Tricharina praecox]KAI5845430.1 hypothetical protein BZA05DRAFT_150123 [Tricharina praecox]